MTSSEEFEVTGSETWLCIKFQDAKNDTSKVKNVMGIIGNLDGVYKDISYQTMEQLAILCATNSSIC